MDDQLRQDQERQVCCNIIHMLQHEPLAYRHFGAYWYSLKARLKALGFGPDQLPILGDYTEPDAVARFSGLSNEAFLDEALGDQQINAQTNWLGQWQADPDPDRLAVFMLDQDLGR